MKPNYNHDCNVCVFLGADTLDNQPVDVYVCPQQESPTIVIRFSDEPSEYTSWNFMFMKSPAYGSPTWMLAHKYYSKAQEALSTKE